MSWIVTFFILYCLMYLFVICDGSYYFEDAWPGAVILALVLLAPVHGLFSWVHSNAEASKAQAAVQEQAWVSSMGKAGCKVTSFLSHPRSTQEVWTCPDGRAVLGYSR